jgi:hypothetical protein
MKTSVHNFRFEKQTDPYRRYTKDLLVLPEGWYCQVYTDDPEFEPWMERMCPTADITLRFNSGNPMYTVYIKEEKEAVLFQLRWL